MLGSSTAFLWTDAKSTRTIQSPVGFLVEINRFENFVLPHFSFDSCIL
jgi:hypothetical protein